MGTTPNLNPTDPWTLAQKFLDNQNKEIANKEYMTHQLNMKTGANIREVAEKDQLPTRRYQERSAVNQADLEGAEAIEAAGLGKEGKSRYRGGAAAQAGDPKFFEEFMDTLKANGITNPLALAAIAGTGQQESGWSPSKIYGEWDDPSASGKPGRSGLALSWREDRLRAAREYAKSVGDDPMRPSAKTQAEFFIRENGAGNNPGLVEKLQNAKDLPTAMKEINKGWGFGDNSHGVRFNNAANYLKTFGNAPLTAKERSTGVNMAAAPVENAKKVDPDGREYFEVQMDADGFRKLQAGMPNARTNLVVDPTKPVGPRGQVVVKQYTGNKVTPSVPVAPAPITTAQAPAVKTRGYNGDEDEL